MPSKTLEVRISRQRGPTGSRSAIHLREPGGTWQSFASLSEVPTQWQPLISRLLKGSDLPDLDPVEPSGPVQPPRQRRRRQVRPTELTLSWLDPLAAFGGFAIAGWALWTQATILLGKEPWNWWTAPALLLAATGIYLGLAFLINRTTFCVDENTLSVRHGPLPWPGQRSLQRDDLIQLFVRVHTRNRGTDYSLRAMTTQGEVRLAGGINRPEELRRLEQEIEDRLGIKDEPVLGSQYR